MPRSIQTLISSTVLWCLVAPAASAQGTSWVPLVVSAEIAPEAQTVFDRLAVELRTSGVTLLSAKQAQGRAEAVVGTVAARVSEATVTTVSAEISRGLSLGAVNEWARAEAALSSFSALSLSERDAVLAQGRVGAKAFLLCVVRAQFVGTESRQAGIRQAQGCLARYPGQRLAAGSPAAQQRLVADAQQAIANPGALSITAAGSECIAVVNGTSVGSTPAELVALPAGTALRVQVRCGHSSRVHAFELAAGASQLVVDPRFDAAVATVGYFGLRYASRRAARNHMTSDARKVSAVFGATEALLAGTDSPGELWLQRVTQEKSFARVRIPISPSGADVLRVARELIPSTAGTKSRPKTKVQVTEDTGSIVPAVVGIGTLATGAVGVGLAWAHYELSSQYRALSAEGSVQYVNVYDVQGGRALLFSGLGAAALSLSAPLLLPTQDYEVLTWSATAIGAIGVGAGVYLTATAERCSATECPDGEKSVYLGPMVLTQSLPFLAIPFTYLVRSWLGDETAEVAVEGGPTGVVMSLRGMLR